MEKYVLLGNGHNLGSPEFCPDGKIVRGFDRVGYFDTEEEAKEFAENYKSRNDKYFTYKIENRDIGDSVLVDSPVSKEYLKALKYAIGFVGNVYRTIDFDTVCPFRAVNSIFFVEEPDLETFMGQFNDWEDDEDDDDVDEEKDDVSLMTSCGYWMCGSELNDKTKFEYLGNILKDKKLAKMFEVAE